MLRVNIPFDANELTYDITGIFGNSRRSSTSITFVCESELYQEDEPQMAQQAKAEFIQFLVLNQRKTFANVQTKVKRKFKRNYNV